MKRIGIIGGLSPESTLYYYRNLIDICNENEQLRGSYPEIIIYSLNRDECYNNMMRLGKWEELTAKLVATFEYLHRAGADFGLISANTPHMVFEDVKAKSPIPLLSIVEETCDVIVRQGLCKVGLIGTIITMQADFYQEVCHKSNISIIVPNDDEKAYIHSKIRSELVYGILLDETRKGFLRITQRMIDEQSIQGLILGCTEIPILLSKEELGIPYFNTAKIHIQGALRYSLSQT